MKRIHFPLLTRVAWLHSVVLFLSPLQAKNGFNLTDATIPIDEIHQGGPPRDGIPSIDDPKFEKAADADWMRDGDLVVAVGVDGDQRAYPIRILVWHEIVNDTVGDKPVAVTYCPLCGTAMTFEREYDGRELTFGVSGLLYQSDVLMFDRETESLWSQLAMKSVSGDFVRTALTWIPSRLQTWDSWKAEHPGGRVLSRDTGVPRDYDRMPYEGYEDRPHIMFPVPEHRTELGNKEWVLGVLAGETALALPEKTLASVATDGEAHVELEAGKEGQKIEVRYDPDSRRAVATDLKTNRELPVVHVFWFAWQGFYPETVLWEP
ncbi:MAG: DUF3179 domain-containing protein [Verrucomicrobiales bacterium]